MSDLLPLFPLPNVVLFPNVSLPLHIFEPPYRAMVADAVGRGGDRLIGMVLLREGWEKDYAGQPPVYAVGCSGLITHVEPLSDGRYHIVLRGLERFRILSEEHTRSYRRGIVESLPEPPSPVEDRAAIRHQRAKLEAMLSRSNASRETNARTPSALSDEDLVHALAQYLDLEPIEKQALLEHESLRARAEALVELLEMKTMIARAPGTPGVAH